MTQHANKGHGDKLLDMMRSHDLCAIDTYFKPKRKKWNDRHRYCNATYIPKDATRRPTKLDYLLISNRWKSMVMNIETSEVGALHISFWPSVRLCSCERHVALANKTNRENTKTGLRGHGHRALRGV